MTEDGDGPVDMSWEPANDAERAMVAALETGDGAEYANLLLRSPLLLPVLPAPDTADWESLTRRIPLSREHVMVYTSAETLAWSLGGLARGHNDTDLPSLRARWEDPARHLAVNPGSPISVSLPVDSVTQLREGQDEIVPVEALADSMTENIVSLLRQSCLDELGAEQGAGTDSPAGALQSALWDAADRQDTDAFLALLLDSTVFVPTEREVSGAELARELPWLTVGPRDSPLVPVFSSRAGLEATSGPRRHHVEVPFVLLLARWPGPDHALCFDPGARTELILPGDVLLDLFTGLEPDGAR
ncbi:SseB family protein [Prauserella cavernicola]|uniref:SseB family protein n=1 Tax=Prauserella cavernicola TaxID=2800127 RepID=A0A934V3B1_9PSEU|nr:SseB family protein [Prauserella cavernicola]MBK1783459.1 SseB family protein [Prauserella cavernicola]